MKTIIVMADGKWNEGQHPKKFAGDAKKEKIKVHTVTFLENADQTDMIQVANTGGGSGACASHPFDDDLCCNQFFSSA